MTTFPQPALEQACSLLRDRLAGLEAIYLFGSVAAGALRADSGVDLAVLCAGAVSPLDRFEAEQACARCLWREVDLVDLRAAPLPLQAAIVVAGRVLLVVASREVVFLGNAFEVLCTCRRTEVA
jgi:predicted nucleotidyltransferase